MMIRKCFLLFHAQMKNEWNRISTSKGGTSKMIIGVICGLLIAFYSYYLSYRISSFQMADLIPGLVIIVTSLMVFFFTVVKTNGVLFAYGEYDTLMSFPVKTTTVITSRFLTMYVMNLIMTALIMLPAGIGYAQWVRPEAFFYAEWALGILVAPLLPTTFAAILGTLIILISSRFKKSNIVAMILYPIMGLGALILRFSFIKFENTALGEAQIKALHDMAQPVKGLYLPAAWFYDGIVLHDLWKMTAFIAGSFAVYYVFVKLVSMVYKRLNTALTTHHVRNDYKVTSLHSKSPLAALYKKEVKRFFSSPMYCVNMMIGCLTVIVIAAGSFFFDLSALELTFSSIGSDIPRLLPFVIGILVSLTYTTCISLSLEGKCIWIIKTLPLNYATVYKSKILFNLTLQLPCVLFAAICFNIRFSMPPITRALLFITPTAFALFGSVGGMFLNLSMPDYGWSSETALIKQNTPSMCAAFGALLAGGALAGISLLFGEKGCMLYTAVITVILLIWAWRLWRSVKRMQL